MIAEERCDFAAAKQWYYKSLAISDKQGNEYGAAHAYHQLGILEALQDHLVESGRWLVRAIISFSHQQDAHYAKVAMDNFLIFYHQAPPENQAQLRQIWEEAGLGPFPEDGNPP